MAAHAAPQVHTSTGSAATADAAWATSDTLHVAAAMLGSRILRQAADAYDRAARTPHGRIPPPTSAGNQLGQATRFLSAFAYLTGDQTLAPTVLITRLAALAEAVAAHAAAERLYAAARPAPRMSTVAQLAVLSIPQPLKLSRQPPAPGQPSPEHGGPRPAQPRPPGLSPITSVLLTFALLSGHHE